MDEQSRHENTEKRDRSVHADSVERGSRFGEGERTPSEAGTADERHERGETDRRQELQQRASGFGALEGLSDLLSGPVNIIGDSFGTYVTDRPQWFHDPRNVEVRVRAGDDVFDTDGFRPTTGSLTAEARTRTGTTVSLTVADTDQRPGMAGERGSRANEHWRRRSSHSSVVASVDGRETV